MLVIIIIIIIIINGSARHRRHQLSISTGLGSTVAMKLCLVLLLAVTALMIPTSGPTIVALVLRYSLPSVYSWY